MKKLVSAFLTLCMLSTCFITTVTAGAPPSTTVKLKNVEKLIHFIQTVDVDNLQNGAYKNGISSLRENGELLVPSYAEGLVENGMIEVLHDRTSPDGYAMMIYYYYPIGGTSPIKITIKQINQKNAYLLEEGLSNYFAAQYGDSYSGATEYEATIGPDGKKTIPYIAVPEYSFFIKDGFEIGANFNPNEDLNRKYINDLCLDIVPLENGEGSPAPSTSPSTSPEVSPSTVPSVQPSPSAESVKTPVAIPKTGGSLHQLK